MNPFGVIFNPSSIFQLLLDVEEFQLREEYILKRNAKYFHYNYHSVIFGHSQEELVDNIKRTQSLVRDKLLNSKHLFLTFGTAWVWKLLQSNSVVANCHKMPSDLFKKELSDLRELQVFGEKFVSKLLNLNSNLQILLTVSPVRHSREGLHGNNISKSVLHMLCHQLCGKFDSVVYFPSYELVVDELRDYRFYKEDLVHPNKQAIDFVFSKFRASFFDDNTSKMYALHEQLRKATTHRFMNATPEEIDKHQKHIQTLKTKLGNLSD